MAIDLASGADNISDIGLMLKSARLAEASKESEIRLKFARDVAAPLLAQALGSKRVWVFGSAATERSRSDSDVDILVEGGEGFSASKRLSIAYDIISSLDVPCGCDVVVMTAHELATRKEVSFIKSMLQERTLVYDRE
ncbi:MAG: nucleotidyltransferase domain-containing protein [Gallionellaceae bacterium]